MRPSMQRDIFLGCYLTAEENNLFEAWRQTSGFTRSEALRQAIGRTIWPRRAAPGQAMARPAKPRREASRAAG